MAQQDAKFVQGSTLKHVLTMSGAGSVGLMALFVVDLLDMVFISMLGQIELAAAVGFAGTLLFFASSISIATSIAMGALVSKALGANAIDKAKSLVTNILIFAFAVNVVVTAIMVIYIPELVALIGASGDAASYAQAYLYILLPTTPIIALGMASGAALRATGDAKRSMWATIIGGLVNAVLDPIFIFGFGWGVEGAAIASVVSRITVLLCSIIPLIRIHELIGRFDFTRFKNDILPIFTVAGPAMLTNIATPIGNAYVTATMAQFGENFVAGFAVVGRILPVAFAAIFALSGAIGPIIGQNYGAQRIDRVKQALSDSILVVVVYCLLVCLLLFLLQNQIISLFSLTGDAAYVVNVYCTFVALTFSFNGIQFVANASFNNLGKPLYSTFLNIGKATAGTIPFVFLGSLWFGAVGVIYGQAAGNIVFGVIAYLFLRKHVNQMVKEKCIQDNETILQPVNVQPFCTHDAVVVDEIAKGDELVAIEATNK
jgi:putative MATE family efflux protein